MHKLTYRKWLARYSSYKLDWTISTAEQTRPGGDTIFDIKFCRGWKNGFQKLVMRRFWEVDGCHHPNPPVIWGWKV